MKRYLYILSGVLVFIMLAYFLSVNIGQPGENEHPKKNTTDTGQWVGAWTASMQSPFAEGISRHGFENQTIRMIIHPQIDGEKMRLRLSNTFGSTPLTIEEVHAAISNKEAGNVAGTDTKVTFDGNQKVTIPPGEKVFSDAAPLKVKRGKNVAVSIYVDKKSGPATWHPRSIQTTFIANGNRVSDSDGSHFKNKEEAWFWLDGVDVLTDASVKGAVVVLGSSIANGNYSKINANHRWPDYLANRMNQESMGNKMSVLNAGISANQLLNSPPEKGENALARLERDVFSQTGVKGVILHQGLNDIRHHPEYNSEKIIGRMREIIQAAHDQGLKIYGGTLTPFKGSGMYTSTGEQTRQEVNDWIRTSGEFDGVIDFDKALRDPEDPERYLPKYDAGDHLHPNDAGYRKMAESVDLSMFK
ncbi:SGNH/GDSL hydrolase family protein [Thalassobacillus devorans]|uniref:SGNH/GDSL hydrolase family protein n=1 Tax=Thalassobacillus devorans TaxID=279813 RepID=UPI00048E9F87|nr:SGNH/GDSL hydrolase family protein [Thalassobacillus devorans]